MLPPSPKSTLSLVFPLFPVLRSHARPTNSGRQAAQANRIFRTLLICTATLPAAASPPHSFAGSRIASIRSIGSGKTMVLVLLPAMSCSAEK